MVACGLDHHEAAAAGPGSSVAAVADQGGLLSEGPTHREEEPSRLSRSSGAPCGPGESLADGRTGPSSAAGADERLEALVRDYGRLIRHVIRTVGGRDLAPQAEDVEQTVLLGLWQQVAREQHIDHPSSYVYRAAVRETVRALKRERTLVARHTTGPAAVESMPATDDPARGVEAREQRVALARSLGELAPDRALAVRAHLSGFSVAEVMALFGWPYQRARNLVARGMADLRAALRQRGME